MSIFFYIIKPWTINVLSTLNTVTVVIWLLYIEARECECVCVCVCVCARVCARVRMGVCGCYYCLVTWWNVRTYGTRVKNREREIEKRRWKREKGERVRALRQSVRPGQGGLVQRLHSGKTTPWTRINLLHMLINTGGLPPTLSLGSPSCCSSSPATSPCWEEEEELTARAGTQRWELFQSVTTSPAEPHRAP